MASALGLTFATLLAVRSALALRFSQEPAGALAELSASPPSVQARKQRQVMYNFMDAQYYSYITIGGQTITGLLDTGSFDLVVFDKSCSACGQAGQYAQAQSKTFTAGGLKQELYYGSGSVDVEEAFDTVSIGPYDEVNLTFWNGVDAAMPVLQNAAFNSIIGVGPPETPGSDAWGVVADDIRTVEEELTEGPIFPSNFTYKRLQGNVDLATELGVRPTLIKADEVTKFSVCLGQKPQSAGYFIWNDTSYDETPSIFTTVRVIGKHTWTVNMTSMRVGANAQTGMVIGCQNGCGAIVDSGTSLMLMPYEAISTLREHLQTMGADCNDLSSLPKLAFELDGMEFLLPPDAYIAKMTGSMATANPSDYMSTFAAERVPLDIGSGECQLAVMGSSSHTNWGPLWILGMPFFRKYYTIFQVGRSHEDRRLHITPASANCTPSTMADSLVREAHYEQQELRTLNRSNILVPRIVQKALMHSHLQNL